MKKTLLASLLVLTLASPVLAAPAVTGGFQGPTAGAGSTTVAEALKAADDAPVVLTGNIMARMVGTDDKYTFRDKTGEILVDIDDELFHGRVVTPQNTVRLSGKVDKEMFEQMKIDVKMMEILN
ncbi:NirD/YgiW/YdeI family stress tolerance protein [uncultured Desulfovibrio sp.]|uniref:YgiW/YdeI family stress tolerance OB fold protein n=1 Tax=uncultured Desulfovibrio sp. TaxID=167968 RepID=UPI00260C7A8C|nr:NirD/YgiW/YdeI family stress tolerance protein [uncultured Desulfovibrio sp.]